MQFAIHSSSKLIAEGETDNAYQLRNLLQRYIPPSTIFQDAHNLVLPFLHIWCSAEIPPLLMPTPRIVNDSHTPTRAAPVGPMVTLQEICRQHKLDPSRCRRILRRHYGTQNVRYAWPQSEVPIKLFVKS